MKTIVLSLIAGSGVGKSTTAAGVFHHGKLQGMDIELVQEYVKSWAFEGKRIGPFDGVYIFGKQAQKESKLYNKLQFIVTDSPLLLSPIYEKFYSGQDTIGPSVKAFLDRAKTHDVHHIYFLLKRNKPFISKGRYEDEATARQVDKAVEDYLIANNIPYIQIEDADNVRSEVILNIAKQKYEELLGNS